MIAHAQNILLILKAGLKTMRTDSYQLECSFHYKQKISVKINFSIFIFLTYF